MSRFRGGEGGGCAKEVYFLVVQSSVLGEAGGIGEEENRSGELEEVDFG